MDDASSGSWNSLLALAAAEVEAIQSELPTDLRPAALEVPVRFESVASEALVADGFDPDLLGLFTGDPIGTASQDLGTFPAEILLFLESLWDFVEADPELFVEEVRITYLHELGHALGLDEEDLEERGLL